MFKKSRKLLLKRASCKGKLEAEGNCAQKIFKQQFLKTSVKSYFKRCLRSVKSEDFTSVFVLNPSFFPKMFTRGRKVETLLWYSCIYCLSWLLACCNLLKAKRGSLQVEEPSCVANEGLRWITGWLSFLSLKILTN